MFLAGKTILQKILTSVLELISIEFALRQSISIQK